MGDHVIVTSQSDEPSFCCVHHKGTNMGTWQHLEKTQKKIKIVDTNNTEQHTLY